MSTQQSFLVCDNSTSGNYNAWAKPISDWFRTIGYTNTTDSGQLNGGGGGHGGSAGWAALSTVPASGSYYYEIFQTNDSFTQFFVKLEYGSISGTAPDMRITLGTSTNGSGTLTGFVTTAMHTAPTTFTVPSTITQYECDFTGDSASSRIGAMYWRNGINSCQQLLAIERSVNASGAYTSTYVTLWTCGLTSGITGSQQSLYFGIGVSVPFLGSNQTGAGTNPGGWTSVRLATNQTTSNSTSFNGTLPFDTCAPCVGYFDYPCTMVGIGFGSDFAEGVTFTVTLYGNTRTYMVGKNGPFANPVRPANSAGVMSTIMRYD